nr:hypothetical protein [Bacteroides caecimuris]
MLRIASLSGAHSDVIFLPRRSTAFQYADDRKQGETDCSNPAKIRAGILVFCYKISGMGMAVA